MQTKLDWQEIGSGTPPKPERGRITLILARVAYAQSSSSVSPAKSVPLSHQRSMLVVLAWDGNEWYDGWTQKPFDKNYTVTHWTYVEVPEEWGPIATKLNLTKPILPMQLR